MRILPCDFRPNTWSKFFVLVFDLSSFRADCLFSWPETKPSICGSSENVACQIFLRSSLTLFCKLYLSESRSFIAIVDGRHISWPPVFLGSSSISFVHVFRGISNQSLTALMNRASRFWAIHVYDMLYIRRSNEIWLGMYSLRTFSFICGEISSDDVLSKSSFKRVFRVNLAGSSFWLKLKTFPRYLKLPPISTDGTGASMIVRFGQNCVYMPSSFLAPYDWHLSMRASISAQLHHDMYRLIKVCALLTSRDTMTESSANWRHEVENGSTFGPQMYPSWANFGWVIVLISKLKQTLHRSGEIGSPCKTPRFTSMNSVTSLPVETATWECL